MAKNVTCKELVLRAGSFCTFAALFLEVQTFVCVDLFFHKENEILSEETAIVQSVPVRLFLLPSSFPFTLPWSPGTYQILPTPTLTPPRRTAGLPVHELER